MKTLRRLYEGVHRSRESLPNLSNRVTDTAQDKMADGPSTEDSHFEEVERALVTRDGPETIRPSDTAREQ